MTRWPCIIVITLLIFTGFRPILHAQSEEGVKCALLYNFAKFVTWPEKAFEAPASPISVGFVGSIGFASAFGQAIKGKNAAGRDFVVKALTGPEGAQECQIVYIADAAQIPPIVSALKGKPVLIVGDDASLLAAGGIIRFFNDAGKVAFEVNLAAAKAADLQLAPKLLSIAKSSNATRAGDSP
jgi:YfiR/HmsC-like